MDPVNRIVRKVETTVSRYGMIARGDRVVVAVSGGADSVCLLDILHGLKGALDMMLTVAHFDHGLRPGADDHETEFVRALAASLHLDIVVKRADPPLDPGGASLEEKARELRYGFLREVKEGCGARKIATGHTLNDQAETVLMRLLRGSGPEGLSGIRPARKNGIIRPLIGLTREEILSYLRQRRLAHVTDASNFEPACLRNSIRLDLLPRLRTYQPRIVEILDRTAEIARADNEWLNDQAGSWIAEWRQTGPGNETILPISRFRELPEALKNHVVRETLKSVAGNLRRIGLAHIEAVKRLTHSTRPQVQVTLPNRIRVRKAYERLIFSKGVSPPADTYCACIEGTGSFHMDVLGCTLTLEEMETGGSPQELEAGPWTACVDADRIVFPLMLRNFRPGDRFVPLGMKGHKKLKDFFVDMKIPSDVRARIPLLAQGDQLIWVCGLRMDDRFKVTSSTRRVLRASLDVSGSMLGDDLRTWEQARGGPSQGSRVDP
jgi:tRNA(Ile)-lysidine synthase